MKKFWAASALALCASAAHSATINLTVDCLAGFPVIGFPVVGNVGDTLNITNVIGSCSGITATNNYITGPATIGVGTAAYSLAAAGTGNISITPQAGVTYTVPFTVIGPAEPVPTLSEYGMMAVASMIAMFGIWSMRRNEKQ